MNRNKKIFTTLSFILVIFLILASPLIAQDRINPTAFLVYYDDDFELEVFDSTGDYIGEVFIGMELFPGSTIKTYNTSAEIQLDPNGSILKISENSVFQIEAFQTSADESNDFSLFNGKLRVIAARAGLGYENYSIITQSAVCGVRGTDFVIDSIGVLAVNDGAVEFSSLLSGDTINVVRGQIADVFAETFQAVAASAQSMSAIFGGMEFNGTDPGQVPGHTAKKSEPVSDKPADDGSEKDAEKSSDDGESKDSEDKSSDDNSNGDDKASDASSGDNGSGTQKDDKTPDTPSVSGSASAIATGGSSRSTGSDNDDEDDEEVNDDEEKDSDTENEFVRSFLDSLGFEIGSIYAEGETYAKAVIQPEFEIGKFRAKLYLPVIYQDNLFDPESWYAPAGNNEWSFGTDQETAQDKIFDILDDFFLKINYLQWSDNGDDFYFKFGNLDNMTIGHGILMRNFTNNIEFPAVRTVGINTGITFENVGFEAVLDDASDPTIFGGRFVYIPFGSSFPLGIGASAITDINPDSEVEDSITLFDPMVLNAALDIGLPIEPLSLTLFAEAGGLTYKDEDDAWHTETFYNPDAGDFMSSLNNYGLIAGFYGDILSLDYRLEYRLSKGIFEPSFYDGSYLVDKTSQYNAIEAYIANPLSDTYQTYTMGVYGELTMNFFDVFSLNGSYLWPWYLNSDGSFDFTADDTFSITAAVMEDVIPVLGIYGSVSYTRVGLVNSITNTVSGTAAFDWVDTGTIISGELVYPFDSSLDIAVIMSTAYPRDDDGNLDFNDDGTIDPYFAMSIDMRVHF